MKNYDKLKKITLSLLEEIGEDPAREGLIKTPTRVAKAWEFFSKGYDESLDEVINEAVFHEDAKDMVIVRDIEFSHSASIIYSHFLAKHTLDIYQMEK